MPSAIPSNITLFLICFLVAPTDASSPYIFIFSVIDIAKEFFIQYILVNIIINIIIPASENSIFVVPEENAYASHLSSSEFKEYEYFASPS